jgi:sulfite dehydrogenase (cytochrome) subunit B
MKYSTSIKAVSFALALATAAQAAEVSITLPPETGTYTKAAGVELMQANCLICHSTEYVSMQPPMPRKFWEAAVKKMKEKFGAPTPDAQVAALVDYLTANYGVSDKKP